MYVLCYITCYLLYVYTTTKTLYYATLISCWAQSPLLLQHKIVERNHVKVENVCNGFYFFLL